MKILLLGASGFIGSALAKRLAQAGESLVLFARKKFDLGIESSVEYVQGDFSNETDLASAVRGCDVVYHAISTTLPKSSNENPCYDVETNLVPTIRLLNILRRQKVLPKLIFISSGGTVYGEGNTNLNTETDPTNPLCSYGIIKLAIEKYLQMYGTLFGLEHYIVRLANPYGVNANKGGKQGVIPVFIQKALAGLPIEIWGDGNVVRDYIYIDDVVDALILFRNNQFGSKIFNIGSGIGYSLNQLIEEIKKQMQIPLHIVYQQARMFDVARNILDISRASNELEWRPKVSLSQGINILLKNH